MRRSLLLGLPVAALLAGGAVAYHYLHHGNLVQDARQRFARGDVYGAELDLDSYLRKHPGDGDASFHLGLINLAEDNPVAAERNFRRARAAQYNPQALVLPLGEAMLRQHRYDDVLSEFTIAGAPQGAQASVDAVRANAYLGLRRIDEARQAAQAGVAAAPNSPDALLVAARVALNTGDLKNARDLVQRALAQDPKRPETLLLNAELAMHDNDPATALVLSRKVLDGNANRMDAQMAVARALAAQHQDVQASKIVDDVLKRAPHDIGANYLRVVLAVRQRDFATADAALQIISPVIDELPQGDYFLAVTKLGRNQPAQAQEAAAKYAARYPDDPAGQKLLAFAELALHQPDRATAALDQLRATGAQPDADALDLMARAQAMSGDIKGAEQNLAQAAALQPGNTEVLNRLAAARLGLGDVAAGKADLHRSLQTAPDQPVAAMALVQTALTQGDIDEAQATIDALRKAVGNTEVVGVLDAQVKVARLDLAGAEALYVDVLKRFPQSREATFGLIQVEGRLGETKTAQDRLNGWMALHPTDKAGLRMQVKSLMAEGDKKGAIAAAEAAHAGDPADNDMTALLAALYIANRQAGDAVSLLDRVDGGATGQLATLRGQALVAAGRPSDAATVLQAAVAAAPKDLRPRMALAELDMQRQDPDGARSVLTDGLAAAPGNLPLMQTLVGIDLKQHGIKAALATANALQKDAQNMPAALLLPGGALAGSGDIGGAAAAFVAAYQQAPSSELALAAASALVKAGKPKDGQALLQGWSDKHPDDAAPLQVLASMAILDHRMDDARALLERVLKLLPNNAVSLNNIAWVKLQHGDAGAANADAMRAFYLSPGPDTQDTLGWSLVKLGKSDAALPLLAQAAAARPSPPIMYHYAVALQATGHTSDAKAALQKALADGKPFDERNDALAMQTRMGP